MKTQKFNLLNLLLIITVVMSSCKTDTKNVEVSNSNKEASTTSQSNNVTLSTATLPNGKRLTDDAISTYFPDTFMGMEKSGTAKSREMKNAEIANNRMVLTYLQDGARATIQIADMADDQNALNNFSRMENDKDVDTPYSKTRYSTEANGVRITEMEQFRDANSKKVRTQSDVTIGNPRFRISLSTSPKLEGEALSPIELLKAYRSSDLPKLLTLPIPKVDQEAIQAAEASRFIDLDCDVLLPLQTVQKICGTSSLKLKVGSFEKENNCSRHYTYSGSSASVVFLITQYARSSVSKSAVDVQGKGEEKREGDIEGLGDSAHIETAGGNLFLAVAYKNYLLELRSFQDKYDKKECCVCFSKEKLAELARDILPRLEELN